MAVSPVQLSPAEPRLMQADLSRLPVRLLAALLVAIVSTPPVALAAEDDFANEVANAVSTLRKQHEIPALGALVFKADQTVLASGVAGVLRADSSTPVLRNSLWHLGSNTKAMTATLAAVLVEDDKISFETTVHEALPSIAADLDPDAAKITLSQLLNHTAGLPANPPFDVKRRIVGLGNDMIEQRLEVAKWALGSKPASAPGTTFTYSNVGYIIAGAMLEQAGRKPWEQLLRSQVFEPLGISKNAGFGPPKGKQPEGHRADPDDPDKLISAGQLSDNPPFYGPAGTAHMNLDDWMLFGAAHLREGRPAKNSTAKLPDALLSKENYSLLHTPTPGSGSYAFGWGLYRAAPASLPLLVHDGSNTEWFARIMLNRQAGIGILMVTNAANDSARAAIDILGKRISESLQSSAN